MFERYTESARRALFFARYEVSQLGAIQIGTEHILLGLIREPVGLIRRILAMSNVLPEDLRKDVERRSVFREKVATSVEIPFADDTRRALQFAAEEADRLGHSYIGMEHLLLGLLRDRESAAAAILIHRGLRLDDVRNLVEGLLADETSHGPAATIELTRSELFGLVGEIRELVDQLARLAHDRGRAESKASLIRQRLDELERLLGG